MYIGIQTLAVNVLNKIGLVSGTSVQVYTEPQIYSSINDAFIFLFRKRWWDHMSEWRTFALDQTNGVIVADVSPYFVTAEDIKSIYVNGKERKVVKSLNREHLYATGADPLYYTVFKYNETVSYYVDGDDEPNKTAESKTKILKFWPITATTSVDIYYRTRPTAQFKDEETVPFDADVLEWCAAWLTLEAQGSNPVNAAKCKQMFEVSYNDLIASIGSQDIGHGRVANAPLTIRTI